MDKLIQLIKKAIEDGKSYSEIEQELNSTIKLTIESETAPLLKNKNDILAEKKALQTELDEKKKILDKVDVSEYNTLKDLEERRKLSGVKGEKLTDDEIINLKMENRKLQGELKTANEVLHSSNESFNKLQSRIKSDAVKNSIYSELEKLNIVSSADKEILYKAYLAEAEVKLENDTPEVLMKSSDGNLVSTSQYFQNWSKTETASRFIKSPDFTGGGSSGSKGGTPSVGKDEEYFSPGAFKE